MPKEKDVWDKFIEYGKDYSKKLPGKILGGQIVGEITDNGTSAGSIPIFGSINEVNSFEKWLEQVEQILELKGVPTKYLNYQFIGSDLREAHEKGMNNEQAINYAVQKGIGRWLDQREKPLQKMKMQDPQMGPFFMEKTLEKNGDKEMNIKQQTPQNTIIPAVQNPVLENLRKRFLEEIAKGGGDMADWNFKAPEEWTEDELKEAMLERERSKNQARKKEMMEQERKYFDHRFGGGKVEFDETGKMIQPRPVRGPIRSIMPIKSKEGQTMEEAAFDLINRSIPNPSGERYQEPRLQVMPSKKELYETDVVKSLQSGLNLISGQKNAQSPSPQSMSVKLKEDGVLGPKTASGLKKALVEDGTNKVSEAIGLGQFKETVKKAKKTGGVENLAGELSGSIGRLLPQSKTPKMGFQPEGLALQDTLNDLGANLKDDGIVGPKTTESFNQLVKQKDEDEIVNLFGKNLCFQFK